MPPVVQLNRSVLSEEELDGRAASEDRVGGADWQRRCGYDDRGTAGPDTGTAAGDCAFAGSQPLIVGAIGLSC